MPLYFEGEETNPRLVLTESAAIFLYLLEKYDKKYILQPKPGDIHTKAKLYQFCFFASSELYSFIAKSWEIMYRPSQTPEKMGIELAELGQVRQVQIGNFSRAP